MLAFLDIETTGLDLEHDDVLELACLVTNDHLAEVARYHAVVAACREFYAMPEVVRDMHTKNGLWAESNGPRAKPLIAIDIELAAFLREHAVKIEWDDDVVPAASIKKITRPQLAGNGIHFDRAFLRRCLPRAEAELHYRQLDVTSVGELLRRFWPSLHDGRPQPITAHRAIPDVEESLAVARHYALNFQLRQPVEAGAR